MRKKNQLKADGLKGNLKADPALARELDEYGYNQDALNALSFMKGVASLEVIEKFIVSAHHRLMMTLREVAVRREFTARTRLIEKRILAERRRVDTNPQASITSTGQAVTKK